MIYLSQKKLGGSIFPKIAFSQFFFTQWRIFCLFTQLRLPLYVVYTYALKHLDSSGEPNRAFAYICMWKWLYHKICSLLTTRLLNKARFFCSEAATTFFVFTTIPRTCSAVRCISKKNGAKSNFYIMLPKNAGKLCLNPSQANLSHKTVLIDKIFSSPNWLSHEISSKKYL